MDIPVELFYGLLGLIIGLILASGGHNRTVAICSPSPGMIVVVDDSKNVFVSGDQGNTWIKRGKMP